MEKPLIIIKKTGVKVEFEIEKLKQSFRRSEASEDEIEEVTKRLIPMLKEGMNTGNIYQLAYSILKQTSKRVAGRYKLKKAIEELGPEGFPFEILVAELIKTQGYEVQNGVICMGKCVKHEVDVLADSAYKRIAVECKFHGEPSKKNDVKIALYVHSRFRDLEAKWQADGILENRKMEGWLVTNTRFSDDAIQYGTCSGMKLISWDFPMNGSLRALIDKSGLHPITSLQSLTKKEKSDLIKKKIILCSQLTDKLLEDIGVKKNKSVQILTEASSLT